MKKKRVRGEYCASTYAVWVDNDQVYTAGNSWADSQAYVAPERGVGLEKMKEYCEISCRAIAQEKDAIFVGVEEMDDPFEGVKA